MQSSPRISIIGASIAGLTLAKCLSQSSIPAELYDMRENKPEGSGILLTINANRVLNEIGLLNYVEDHGCVLSDSVMLTPKGDVITRINFTVAQKEFGFPMIGIRRQTLNDILAQSIPNLSVVYKKKLLSIESTADEVTLKFAQGNDVRAAIVVGCDGLHSTVRHYVYRSQPDPLNYCGYTAWRGVCTAPRLAKTRTFQEFLGRGMRFGIVPISASEIYWYATAHRSQALLPKDSTVHKNELLAMFTHWAHDVSDAITATDDNQVIRHETYTRRVHPCWYKGPIVLTGDAAHSMQPVLGQGASMAIESAFELANCLTSEADATTAFQRYQNKRSPRVKKIVDMSHLVGKITGIDHPIFERLRNAGLRHSPSWVVKKQLMALFSYSL